MQFRTHLRSVSRRPAAAQTVQQLKYDTLLIYMQNAFLVVDSMLVGLANVNNVFFDLGDSIPYKGFYGGGGGGGGGDGDGDGTGGDGDGDGDGEA